MYVLIISHILKLKQNNAKILNLTTLNLSTGELRVDNFAYFLFPFEPFFNINIEPRTLHIV